MIKEIVDAVTIPVMAKVRIGHFVEAQILQAIGVGVCACGTCPASG
jgi:pyridoxal 5'-phosphate synthase pdxS subunit